MFSSVDTLWVLLGAALVFFMQAGFAMVEAGFTRAKNSGNIIMKNLMDFAIGTPLFWLLGFGLMFGGTGALVGGIDFLIQKDYSFLGLSVPHAGIYYFSDGVLRHGRDHRIRRDGGANQVRLLLYIQCGDQSAGVSHIRPLDLGRRMAGSDGLP